MLAAFLRSLTISATFSVFLLFLLLLLRIFSPRPWIASMLVVAITVAIDLPSYTDVPVQLPLGILSAALTVLLLTRYGLLAGAASVFVSNMSSHALASLDLSSFFGRTMVAGVLLLAAPALIGFYVSAVDRSLVGRRFDLIDTPGTQTHP